MKTAASPSKSISSEIYVETVTHISADITEVRSGKSSFFNLPRKMSRPVQKGWEFLGESNFDTFYGLFFISEIFTLVQKGRDFSLGKLIEDFPQSVSPQQIIPVHFSFLESKKSS